MNRLPVDNHDDILPASSSINLSTYRDQNSSPTCEAGLFSVDFACDATDTDQYRLSTTVVWLCTDHKDVISIKTKSGGVK